MLSYLSPAWFSALRWAAYRAAFWLRHGREMPPFGSKPCKACGDEMLRFPSQWMRTRQTVRRKQPRPAIVLPGREVEVMRNVRHEPDPRPAQLVAQRPATRGECAGGQRPCPWVSCRHHLYLDVLPTGAIRLNFPHLEPWEMEQTCSLDVADAEERTLEGVGEMLNVTRERLRQIESDAIRVARPNLRALR
jgi:hypothetical protein